MSPSRRRLRPIALLVLVIALVAAACGSDDGASDSENGSFTLYSGRSENLVQPLIDQFTEETGIAVDVRYGNSAEMAAQILEEGSGTPADVFYSQEVGAMGALADAGLLTPLPAEVVDSVDPRFAPSEDDLWVGVTGRSRAIVYNPELVDDPPTSVADLTDPQYEGQVAWAPTNASFQSFVTGYRVAEGEEAASEWLDAMIANDTESYENNVAILDAVNEGQIGIGLINHYYWSRSAPELGDELVAELVFPVDGDPGGLINATAVGITTSGEGNEAALAFVEYLLSDAGQTYFVEETFEYPVVPGVPNPEGVPPLAELDGPALDLADLKSLEASQALLTEKGLLS
ncbi:iron ABC transporter substrate-binding protein [Rhabdothermincola salaria]|uniref:iron ABC transporter substrate-binding protein n=1 Tax=Rhabdothermincola salaria TaxID=2903142 RepID=UPI001E3F747A|nr:iron ABC transporter substrate-binding protein [Rhabdothermincola salaria]MCD9624040.1 iron ABC transporter substrate-binding protein [Rhabdothermincola salaria]